MELKEVVQQKYGEAALRVRLGGSSCCGAAAALENCCDPITSNLYEATQTGGLPEDAVLALPAVVVGRASVLAAAFEPSSP